MNEVDLHNVTPETTPAQVEALRFAFWMLVEALEESGHPVRERLLARMGDTVWLHGRKPEVRAIVEYLAAVIAGDDGPPAG